LPAAGSDGRFAGQTQRNAVAAAGGIGFRFGILAVAHAEAPVSRSGYAWLLEAMGDSQGRRNETR